jgi:hypothetical protein
MTSDELEKANKATPEYEAHHTACEAHATALGVYLTAREADDAVLGAMLAGGKGYDAARKACETIQEAHATALGVYLTAQEFYDTSLDDYRATPEFKALQESQDD